MKKLLFLFMFLLLLSSCMKKTLILPENPSRKLLPDLIKLEHLIKITYQDRKFIFHGFFYKDHGSFFVNALGDFDMSLFSLEYKNSAIQFEIYLDQLREKSKEFDFKNVGKDIWKIYFPETKQELAEFNAKNPLDEVDVKLRYDEKGYLKQKILLDRDQKPIVEITYSDYEYFEPYYLPTTVHLKHAYYQIQVKTVGIEKISALPAIKK